MPWGHISPVDFVSRVVDYLPSHHGPGEVFRYVRDAFFLQ